MKKILAFISVLCIIFMLGTMSVSAENTLFDFEDSADIEAVSASPASGSEIKVTADPDDSKNKCLHITDNDGSSLSNAEFLFGKQIVDTVEVSFKVKFSKYDVYSIVLLNGGNNTAMVSFIGRANGKLSTYDGSTEKEICAYELDKWYDVKFIADVSKNKFDIELDGTEVVSDYTFRNSSSGISSFRAGTVSAGEGDFYIDDVSVPYLETAKIPLTTATPVEQISLAKADDDKPNLDYLAFPTLAEVEENKIAVGYKRGYQHAGDYSDLEVTYIDKSTGKVISRETIESSTEVCYQNPDFITMPNGDTYCYTDIQKPGTGRIGVTTHKYNKETGEWDLLADQFYCDKGIQYGYMFDGICDGNRLYMLAMAFPTLENKGYGRSVHVLYTDDNGLSWKHLACLTDLIDVSINESGFMLYKDEILVLSRGDDSSIHMYRIDKQGNLKKYNNITATYSNIWQAARPKLFTYNDRYYFSIRSFPNRGNQNYQEYTVFEFNPETLEVLEGIVLDTRNGSAGDAYYGEHYINEKDGKKYIHFIVHATKFTSYPSIDDYVFAFDDIIKPETYEIDVENNIVNVSGNMNNGVVLIAYYKEKNLEKVNIYLPEDVKDFELQSTGSYDQVKIMWWANRLVALCAEKTVELESEEASDMSKYISILGDSISSYGGYSDDISVNTTLSQNVASSLYRGDSAIMSVDETWWMQAINQTGMKLLVNNTWGGSRVFGASDTSARYNAYVDRCVNLHANAGPKAGTNPDVIAVYIGINDVRNNYNTIGSFEDINFDALIKENNGTYTYATPTTFAEAYSIMIHKIIKKYPDAEVYCFNLLPEAVSNGASTADQVEFTNSIIFKIADKFDLNKVDLYNNSGITVSNVSSYTKDGLHPNALGMDLLTDVFVNALKEKYSF